MKVKGYLKIIIAIVILGKLFYNFRLKTDILLNKGKNINKINVESLKKIKY